MRREDNETLFQNAVSLNSTKGVVSLGFPVKTLTGFLNDLNLHNGELYLWTKEGIVFAPEDSLINATLSISNGSICFGNESKSVRSQCIPGYCSFDGYKVEIERSKFQAFCSVVDVSGVPLRYTLLFPNQGGVTNIKKDAKSGMFLLICVTIYALLWPLGFMWFMMQAAKIEMHLRGTLITQMEATQQAERKSMNKSHAFASASHDIRGGLTLINALLNSVLDMSKIESGKMQLDEVEFNLGTLLEDVVDFFHPVAMKKGVDVVLDLNDGSVFKNSNVRGDSAKLKQIINNLVSNAVKFTVDGHISIRAWAQRPGSTSSVALASDPKEGVSKFFKSVFPKNEDHETEIPNSMRNNANMMEFVFEVDDTGKGIPIEMRKSVFENYVQVRETARGTQGTGLGLGIVQSLVRLMGGEIRITDKAIGEKGTCFHFNVLMTTLESSSVNDMRVRHDIEAGGGGDYVSTPNLGLTINTSMGGSNMNIRNLSPRFNNCLSLSPKQEPSKVVLLLKQEERRRVTEKYIKSLGIKVTVVEKWEHLNHALEILFGFSPSSSMGRGESSLPNELSSTSLKELPLIGMDSIDSRSQVPKRRNNSFSAFVLLVIDAKTGPISELYNIVEQFRRGLHRGIACKVVWLNEPSRRGSESRDVSFSKPLHGSRLNRVLKMLPEFGGTELKETSTTDLQRESVLKQEIQEEETSSRYNKKLGKSIMGTTPTERENWDKSVRTIRKPIKNTEEEQRTSTPSNDELFLKGKRVLLADDTPMAALLATKKLKKMGASEVTKCVNGKEVVSLVSDWFTQREQQDSANTLPFDYIFMDCQMPEMDGYEATREIRKVESKYGVHIPIIAVSGHDPDSKEAKDTVEAGMDAFLDKNMNQLSNIIREIESKKTLK
ncbi:hypothetical protein AALP_AA4G263200 [Arabis alpina]|uniref:histidine kinase n=1 Tax=Arabis alpina TaxID=50452 RepID=A0A087H5T0_ARAAL|nr:hypothetical protein AALP_AA4G263200 [Arabis alpina]